MSVLEKILGKELLEQFEKVPEETEIEIDRKEIKEVKLADLRERISAHIGDLVIVAFFVFLILFIPYLQVYLHFGFEELKEGASKTDYITLVKIIYFFYAGLLIGDHGWTLAKRSAKIKVVTEDDFKEVGFTRAFLREGIKVGLLSVPYLSIPFLLLNLYLIKYTPKRQAIHDKIVGTQVIVTPTVETLRIF
ncbi:MAG: RDD family protein [bacterium]